MEQVRFTLEVDDLNRNKHDARQNTTSASRASHHSPTREQRALSLLKVREVRRTRMLERAELDTVGATAELNLTHPFDMRTLTSGLQHPAPIRTRDRPGEVGSERESTERVCEKAREADGLRASERVGVEEVESRSEWVHLRTIPPLPPSPSSSYDRSSEGDRGNPARPNRSC